MSSASVGKERELHEQRTQIPEKASCILSIVIVKSSVCVVLNRGTVGDRLCP